MGSLPVECRFYCATVILWQDLALRLDSRRATIRCSVSSIDAIQKAVDSGAGQKTCSPKARRGFSKGDRVSHESNRANSSAPRVTGIFRAAASYIRRGGEDTWTISSNTIRDPSGLSREGAGVIGRFHAAGKTLPGLYGWTGSGYERGSGSARLFAAFFFSFSAFLLSRRQGIREPAVSSPKNSTCARRQMNDLGSRI